MSDMFFDFESAINKVKENVVQTGEEYERMCDDVYSAYPAFRDEWMKRLGYERKLWTEKYVIDEKDEFYMFKTQYNYFLSLINGCIRAQEDLFNINRRAMKLRLNSLVGEFIIPKYKKYPITLDCAEICCVIDFFWSLGLEREDRKYSLEDYKNDVDKLKSYIDYEKKARVILTPAQKQIALETILKQKRKREELISAFKERKKIQPLTKFTDLI